MPFQRLGLPPPVVKGVRAAGYTEPTPIQLKAIPAILTGRDLVGAAQTGSGKTAAFLLPILARLLDGPSALRALVLVPTRELAAQVETNGRDYARFTRLRVGVVYGGVPIGPQERMLRNEGVDLLVATPGRLLDLQGRQSVSLDDVRILVLDEADRMVDMGFAPDLQRILRLIRRDRQTMMFSATMPPTLNKVAQAALQDPVRVDLAPPSRPAAGITQAVYPVPRHLKVDLLHEVLGRSSVESVIVFTRTKHGADRLTRQLSKLGHSVVALHGNRTQSQRERALRDLKRGRVQALIATDIASRGIDVDDITHIINYDVPHTPEDYVHRIGRTGRMEATGDAFTLMSPEERDEVDAIERFLGRAIPRVILPDFDYKKRAEPRDRVAERERRSERDRPGGRRGREAPRPSRPSIVYGPGRPGSGQARPAVHEGAEARGAAGSGRGTRHGSDGATADLPSLTHGRRPQRNAPGRRNRKRM